MAIRITRNEAGNCITFVGSSNPVYWNACLSAQINEGDSNLVDIINDIRSANEATIQYEFYAVEASGFADKDGNAFSTPQEMVDYVNANANVVGVSGTGADLTDVAVNFRLDETSTSIIMDNGASFGVNTIKAVADVDGTIHLHAIGAGSPDGAEDANDHKHFEKLIHTNVSVNGNAVAGGLNDVVNTLNELFTVGAFESVVIADPYSTMIADVAGTVAGYTLVGSGATDPAGDDIFTNTGTGNYAGLKSTETIDQAGEYFTFDIRGEGQIGFGLVHTQTSYDDGYFSGNSTYADPTTFAVGNSAHFGYQFSHWFHPTPNGSWTNYGANTGIVYGPGWYNWESQADWLAGNPVKIRCGIDTNGFISIESLQDDNVTWVVHARSSYPVADGAEFHLGIKSANPAARVFSAPKVHLLEPAAPTMYFRYIESPDGVFNYPLFTTTEEAEYYDQNHDGVTGTGTVHTHIYVDDATNTTWYMPDTGATMNGSSAPSGETFMGNPANYTEITSLSNSDLVPSPFSDSTVTVNELQSVNIQVTPAGSSWTTTITDNDSSGLNLVGSNVEGTAPEVTGDNVANPSDDYTITVTRTSSYGSSTGTLTVRVNNLTAPATAISGFTHDSSSASLVDSDTMADGSAVHANNTLNTDKRFVIEQAYVETNILPALQAAGDKYYIGIPVGTHDFTTVTDSDWDAAIVWEYESASSHSFKFIDNGTVVQNVIISSLTDAFYDYAIEAEATSAAWLIACNVNSINTEPSPADGGSFSNTRNVTGMDSAEPHTIHMAVVSTTGDFSTTGISEIDVPVAATNLTSWTKALDFNGSNEHGKQVANYYTVSPLHMNGYATNIAPPTTPGNTANGSSVRPWATAVVFQSKNVNSNQHIWNSGEGAGTGDDNIYLRVDATGNLYFGWGRQGDVNECKIGNIGGISNASHWWGVYIANNGTRQSGTNASAATLASAFDIRLMGSNDTTPWGALYDVGTEADWTAGSTGAAMNRAVTGELTIGGRGSNRNFHGKVASMVVTTLRVNKPMPTDAEIEMMITDPKKWLDDYKIGEPFRSNTSPTDFTGFAIGTETCYRATQVWLMGEGTYDSYANGIRNQVGPEDQNTTKMQLNSMVSNDIETVSISGLT